MTLEQFRQVWTKAAAKTAAREKDYSALDAAAGGDGDHGEAIVAATKALAAAEGNDFKSLLESMVAHLESDVSGSTSSLYSTLFEGMADAVDAGKTELSAPELADLFAAGLEEHYPHSMARAVVTEAEKRGITHEERHSSVNYIVAHGIASSVDGEKVVIGSHHFVFEDEKCVIPAGEEEKFESLPAEYSHLYLAAGGVLAAVICIEDPLRAEAAEVVRGLRSLGFTKLVMMTGDSDRTAKSVAAAVGVDEYYSEVLPEDKANFIRREHEAGRRVIMLGDGVNDSPALSEADAGIAIRDGAAIAREVADITIGANDLYSLLTLRRLSTALMERIHTNYRNIIGFNFMLICLGVMGILPPATSALLHNAYTLTVSLQSMTRLLPPVENE